MPSTPEASYNITHTFWKHSYEVSHPNSNQTLFYVENSHWTPGKPTLSFHESNENGPIKAVARLAKMSRSIECGIGDPSNPAERVAYETMTNIGFMKLCYMFKVDRGHGHETFIWKKTRSHGSGFSNNYKMVNDATQKVIAVFSSAANPFSPSKAGRIDIYANYGERFNLMTLITGIALHEQQRRARAAASAAGAGGGGGA
ncbi:hypothetical protein N7474_010433 [Penicillium riverlandense]|uniref:uncharacterized protein n=1 Tax=Penicillium riverlandense TaxID=1903569 RepID=UPI0025485D33|nr:uncharacterized protein N7474_010433 [Penicillium riverlandense]KAJ5806841.1 hypothetical protein N7474_010433 [Penicillium riverlandense]